MGILFLTTKQERCSDLLLWSAAWLLPPPMLRLIPTTATATDMVLALVATTVDMVLATPDMVVMVLATTARGLLRPSLRLMPSTDTELPLRRCLRLRCPCPCHCCRRCPCRYRRHHCCRCPRHRCPRCCRPCPWLRWSWIRRSWLRWTRLRLRSWSWSLRSLRSLLRLILLNSRSSTQ